MRAPSLLVSGLAVIALSGCGGGDDGGGETSFKEALDGGASCQELFDIRNDLDPKDPLIPDYNEMLREIGCYSSSSERTDQ